MAELADVTDGNFAEHVLEPGTLALAVLGLLGLTFYGWLRRK